MNFYSFDDINAAACCLKYANEVLPTLGYDVKDGRIQAKWRGGKGFNVAINEHGWFDHKTKDKGGVISLCALTKFGGDDSWNRQQAQDFLGGWLGLTPKFTPQRIAYDYQTQSTRYKQAVADGYHEVKKYIYTNADGIPCHYTIRMEHATKTKTFFQCTPYSSSLKDAELHLYNLPTISGSDWAVVVEGEKDADTLIGWGVPATTCNCGAANWKDSYTEELRGKDVVICRDNDDAGAEHAHVLLRALANAAKSLRVICPSKRRKGDVTDWFEKERGTAEKFYAMVKSAPLITAEEAMWSDKDYALFKAKEANKTAFSNVVEDTQIVNGKERRIERPCSINDLVDDIHTRLIGFPKKIGDYTLFDLDRDTGRVELIDNRDTLFAWIGQKTKHCVNWTRAPGSVSKSELFAGLIRAATRYEKASSIPDFPKRPDVFYTFTSELKPTTNHEAFETFLNFFNPDGEDAATLLRTFVAAPMYYRTEAQRPCWIIDSHYGQAVGKTTLVDVIARLYSCDPIRTSKRELENNPQEILKRIVSATGRNSRILLVDNLKGVFDNEQFADLVTSKSISGRAPYGHGEEVRPNDLTYVITSNSANVGADMASRSFFLFLSPPKAVQTWSSTVFAYIERHRLEIFGDIIDILASVKTPETLRTRTRTPEFEREVLFPMAGDEARFNATICSMLNERDSANIEEERARDVADEVHDQLRKEIPGFDPDAGIAFIRSNVLTHWLKSMKVDVQDVRNMVNTNRLRCFHREIKSFPLSKSHPLHARGILYIGPNVVPESSTRVPILRLTGDQTVVLAGTVDGGHLLERLSAEGWFSRSDAVVEVDASEVEAPAMEQSAMELDMMEMPI